MLPSAFEVVAITGAKPPPPPPPPRRCSPRIPPHSVQVPKTYDVLVLATSSTTNIVYSGARRLIHHIL